MLRLAKLNDGPEIYLAIQGEGFTVGVPMVFVRLSGCPLHCKFCDTYYTWNWENTPFKHEYADKVKRADLQMEMSPQEVADYIQKVAGINHKVVFTGGEPTLQQQGIIDVIDILNKCDDDWYYEIETAATITLRPQFLNRISAFNVSPKLESSGNPKHLRDKPNIMRELSQLTKTKHIVSHVCFKFVVCKDTREQDMKEIDELVEKYKIPKSLVYLMPEGIETAHMIEWSREVAEICKEKSYLLSTRIQILLYGPKRAV